MVAWLQSLHPVLQALAATLFTWLMTAAGALLVFGAKTVNQKVMDGMLGLASGVMIAASFWSLLAPAIEMSSGSFVPALVGFLAGGLVLYGLDKVLPHLHPYNERSESEGPRTRWRRSVLLVLAITLHNIPEGLAVGVAFGAAASGLESASVGSALALAFGIGIQNFPEGLAVAMPLRREKMSRARAFFIGQASGFVEPVAGVVGAAAVMLLQPILPYALAFAAGAMIFVVVEELIPEAQAHGNNDFATMGAIVGFAVMMLLDVALG
jgi:ZIP family zinc transporter